MRGRNNCAAFSRHRLNILERENVMKTRICKRILSALTAGVMLSAAVQTTAPMTGLAAKNLISNSTFDTGTSGWAIYKESGGAGKLSVNDGRLALNVTSLGKLNYAVQLYYDIVPLYQNAIYHVHYEISSTVNRYVEGMIQQNGGTYQSYTWKGLNLTPEPLVVDYTFPMKKETDIMAKFCFNCGLQEQDGELPEHTIYLDNVVIEIEDDSQVDYSQIGPYQAPILTNQIGFRTDDRKTAVIRKDAGTTDFAVVNAATKQTAFTGKLSEAVSNTSADETDYIADFSQLTEKGKYYITCGSLDPSYEFIIADDPYAELMNSLIRMFYLQRCGCEVTDSKFGHKACHTDLATVYGTSEKIDVSGGWHDAGDYGRYVVAGAKAVADLLYAYDANPSLFTDQVGIPESGNGIPDILDETRYELEWMLKMQASSGGVYHKVTCDTFPGYVMPTAEVKELIATPISSTATADFCSSMAMAAEFYAEYDSSFAAKCLDAAKKAWAFLEQNPGFIFKNPADISTGEYGDLSDKDERFWAACQMFRATGDASYLSGVSTVQTGMDWSTVGDYGSFALLGAKANDLQSAAQSAIEKSASSSERNVQNHPYGSPVTKYNWGSNMTIANSGVLLAKTGRKDAATAVRDYLLGQNPLGTCFVTGFGTVSPETPHHRPSMAVGEAQPGMLVGGVNSSLEDSAAKAYCADSPAAKCYVDNSESYSTNEIMIYWNSPLIFLLAELAGSETQQVVAGDVNGDGECSIADAVSLQRFLLVLDTTLPNWKAGDMDKNGKLNAVDLALLKRTLCA